VITVTTSQPAPGGIQEVAAGTEMDIEAGHLIITDDGGTTLAAFAPGVWQQAVAVPEAQAA
jgi:hypothetical protein